MIEQSTHNTHTSYIIHHASYIIHHTHIHTHTYTLYYSEAATISSRMRWFAFPQGLLVKKLSVTESSSELHSLLFSNKRFRRNENYHSFCLGVDPNAYTAYEKNDCVSPIVRRALKAQLKYKYGVCITCQDIIEQVSMYIYMCVYVCVCMYVYAYVCICVLSIQHAN